MIRAFLFLIAVSGCSNGKPPDACESAVARLERIDRAMPSRTKEGVLDSCRTAKYGASDPVLRCAMDSSTDAEAAACIERGIRDVVKPGRGDGSGVNPLLP